MKNATFSIISFVTQRRKHKKSRNKTGSVDNNITDLLISDCEMISEGSRAYCSGVGGENFHQPMLHLFNTFY